MGFPAISVILPTCDRPGFMLAAARSVLAQRMLPAELLVVDDGVAVPAEPLLRALAEHSPFPIRTVQAPRRGPAAARNAGLRDACGGLIAFLDDDDLWHCDKLAWQANWFASEPRLGVLGTDCVRAYAPGAPAVLELRRPRSLCPVSPQSLIRANRMIMSSVVARRECFEQCGGFDESLPLAQDWDMWLRMGAHWSVAILPAPLTTYRLHPLQRSRDEAAMRAWEGEVIRRAVARGTVSEQGRGAARRRLSWAHCRLGRALLRRGELESAGQELRASLSLNLFQPLAWSALARCALTARASPGARYS